MNEFIAPLTGGILIGLSSLAMLALLGRITGISGIFAGAITAEPGSAFRWAFIIGLIAGPIGYHSISGIAAPAPSGSGALLAVIAGALVGFGTRYAGGCTSGHGVCGIGRLSPRSIAATCAFMGSGGVTVFVTRHLLAG